MIDELIRHFSEPTGLGLAAGVTLLAAYLLPVAIAGARGHRYTRNIGAINVVLGWTIIGWFAALFWAVNRDLREQGLPEAAPTPLRKPLRSQEPVWINPEALSIVQYSAASRICPYCAEVLKVEAVVCRYCARDLAPGRESTLPAAKPDERGMRELYDLLQEMEHDTAQTIHDAHLQDHRADHPKPDSIRASASAGEDRFESMPAGEGQPEALPAHEDRLEKFKAERFRYGEISIDEIVNSRDAGITASGRQTSRIKKAS